MTAAINSLRDIDARARDVFRRIVESYLETGEPLGSRNLSRLLNAPLSPASVRNVMADLEDLGLIYSPHTSAGRLPTETGLRFFVDAIMEVGDLTQDERSNIEARVAARGGGATFETVLAEASNLLSGLSRGAGLVITAKQDVRIRHIEFVRIEPLKGLVIIVGDNGLVENRVIDLPPGVPVSALTEAGNYLNARVRGLTLAEARQALQDEMEARRAELDQLAARLVDDGIASWSGGAASGETLIVRGRANLLEDVRAAEDLEKIRQLFDDLENQRDIVQLLGLADGGEGVRIFIGSENKLFSLSGSSLVLSPYRDKDQRIVGALGVIGPTRLNYGRVVPMVDYTARVISRMLG